MSRFKIDNTTLRFKKKFGSNFLIKSFPVNYEVNFNSSFNKIKKILKKKRTFLILDKNIYNYYNYIFKKFIKKKIFLVKSVEINKTDKFSKKIIDFFLKNQVNKSDHIITIGGGIVQDITGYACSIYKRGIPWIYYPTTYLGMTDSCIGGKVGINYGNAKNLLALFSAPKKVIININFLKSLPQEDLVSGLGESLRLHITGGIFSLNEFHKNIQKALNRNYSVLLKIIKKSLQVKKLVVEEDEYELNIRRAMNFGHSFGHAFEILCKHKIPHGISIVIGMCVEIILGYIDKNISKETCDTIINSCISLLYNKKYYKILKTTDLENINKILQNDKKVVGCKIFLALPKKIGVIKFIPKLLNEKNKKNLILARNILVNYIDDKYSFN